MSIHSRKKDHIDISLTQAADRQGHFFDQLHFEHVALPEIDFAAISVATNFLDKPMSAPLIISSMTGGTAEALAINERLARAAESCSIAMGVGSQRAMLEDPIAANTFKVRQFAPSIPLFANIGAVQLNYGVTADDCQRMVDAISADALYLHLNPLQEAIQPEGNTNFAGLLAKIEAVVGQLSVPVIVKEVGNGISGKVAQQLADIGVKYIDVAGRGGTSWGYIEGKRRGAIDDATTFADWGIPTPVAIQECSEVSGITVIAGGGLRSGLDLAKALALGAAYGSMALPFLKAATISEEAVVQQIKEITRELTIAAFAAGARDLTQLKKTKLISYAQ